MACEAFGQPPKHAVLGKLTIAAAGLFLKPVREIKELLPRYEQDNLFDSSKFKQRFPAFEVTSFKEGLAQIRNEWQAASR